jgi:RNA polymerase sigma factor (sigma-70 family)
MVASQVRLAAAGDEAAFAWIVELHHADMARVAYGICGDRALAEDAVQAAWSIAWHKLRTLRDAERIRPWLVAVAANEARHLVRRRHPGFVREIELGDPDPAAPDPSDEIGLVDLENALRRLSPDDRALVILRYGAGFDSAEIAQIVGLSASGVRTRLSRLVDRLRKELDDG